MSIDGILNVNKPEGKTSFSIVALLRWLSGEKHVGHAGTLDPIATGVLPICIGQATRVVQFLADSNKTYLAQIELGIATDTFDREGKITHRKDPSNISVTQIEKALKNFKGSIQQSPPIYSAVKRQGRRLYELARSGIQVKIKPRQVKITSNEIISYELPILTIKVECSKGTYIRSLAHDLGQYLGCGAHISNLTRIQCGPFLIEDSLPLSEIECIFKQGILDRSLHPVDTPLLSWNAVIVDETNELAIKNGCSIPLDEENPTKIKHCRAYSSDGRFLAILHYASNSNLWHPDKVFSIG